MIEVLEAPPFATVQDAGFSGGRSWGLPPGGAMDPFFHTLANRLVGNPPHAAAIEWALGSGMLRLTRNTRLAVVGLARVALNDTPLTAPAFVFPVRAGTRIRIEPDAQHRFSYVAVAGGIRVPEVLGSHSTYLPGAFGGFSGRLLRAGDRLEVGKPTTTPGLELSVTSTPQPTAGLGDLRLRVTRGPQWDRFEQRAREAFFGGRFQLAPASDRMGYRLVGPTIHPRGKATLPSEAACPGAVQIPDGGQPIVLMPDGPTVGGYPKIAVVIQADLRLLAQCLPDRGIRFTEVSLEAARSCYSPAR